MTAQPNIENLIIKQPEYDCPVHGTVVGTVLVSTDGWSKTFCMKCCIDKIIEIGVCEVTEKKP
jgi:hypothetical protein